MFLVSIMEIIVAFKKYHLNSYRSDFLSIFIMQYLFRPKKI